MSKNFTLIACLGVFLSGCAAVAPDAGTPYVSPDGQLQIRGELVDGSGVRIFVNDNKVIDEHVSLIRGDGAFAGDYKGKRVSANCSTADGRQMNGTTCLVAVGSERVRLTL